VAVAPAPAAQRLPLPLAAALNVAQLRPGAVLPFELQLDLAGTERIGWVPLADENRVQLQSTWPHPSFGGDFLPRTRTVSAQGFDAAWSVPSLSTQAQQQFVQQQGEPRREPESFSVSLDNPVDVYRMTERATKYGMMFIVLTFAAFFVLEMVKRWRIHPMQYLMIGAALVLFFLLLLSISEHLDFVWAYAVASIACIGLLAHYLRHVLGGWAPGLLMSGLLVALYGVLYGILVSEDNALMMGSLLLFGVLAAIMIATRKVDWYSVMGAPSAHPPETELQA
jgi:inner membrane protein